MKKHYFFIVFFLIQLNGFANNEYARSINPKISPTATLITPTFGPIGPFCLNSTPPPLLSVSANGISGTWSPSVIQTNAVGNFPYFFTPDPGQNAVAVSITIAVVASSSIDLVSEFYTTQQTVQVNQPIVDIVYQLNGATSATVTGLPPAVYATIEGNLLTIHGFPVVVGFFQYMITLDNGCPGVDPVIGIINSVPMPLTLISGNDNQQVCANTPISPIIYLTDGASVPTVSSLPPGLDAVYENGMYTISGVPVAPGSYQFQVIVVSNGFTEYANIIITVLPFVNIALMSSAPTTNQTVAINTALTPIVYQVGNGATGAAVIGLPIGVTADFAAGNVSIAGSPTTCGTYSYTVMTAGGCGAASLSGTITVSPASLNLLCDAGNSLPNSMAFDWANVTGWTSYDYSYTIGNGPTVSGNQVSPSNFQVPGVAPGQSVTFTVTANGNTCGATATITCISGPLANEAFEKSSFKYYPNPVHDMFYVESDSKITKVSVYNLLGQSVFETLGNENKLQLNLSGLSNGIYLIKVDSETGSETKKIVRQ